MSVEGDIQAVLMAQAETITGYTMLWPRSGGDIPSGEHIRVYHMPNDNAAAYLSGDVMERMGFLVLTLVSDLGEHDVVSRRKAGEIAAFFPRGKHLTRNATTLTITDHTVRPGREESGRWETPIRIGYRGIA